MSVTNRKNHVPLTGPRWRQRSFEPDWVEGDVTFHASLRGCLENRPQLRPAREENLLLSRDKERGARTVGIRKGGFRMLRCAWSWLSASYAALALQRSRVAERSRSNQLDRGQISTRSMMPAQTLRPGVLKQAVSWLNTKYSISATKRLRVAEVVSLGEKRFVALVKVEDREFLIGGGTAGISLLTQLGAPRGCTDAFEHGFEVSKESE